MMNEEVKVVLGALITKEECKVVQGAKVVIVSLVVRTVKCGWKRKAVCMCC